MGALLVILLIAENLVTGDDMSWFMVCWLYSSVILSITVTTYRKAASDFSNDASDDVLDNIFVCSSMVVVILAVYTVVGCVKLRLYCCFHLLRLEDYR